MAKKRTSLDSFFEATKEFPTPNSELESENNLKPLRKTIEKPNDQPTKMKPKKATVSVSSKSEIVKQTVYLPSAVHEQLRQLAFEERKKMHDYLVEGLDRVFKNRGLKPYTELSWKNSGQ